MCILVYAFYTGFVWGLLQLFLLHVHSYRATVAVCIFGSYEVLTTLYA